VEARLLERRAAGHEPLLTATMAAELAGVHPNTVRTAIRQGALEVAGYVGNRPRVRREAVELWVAAGRPSAAIRRRERRSSSRRRDTEGRRVLANALAE